MLTFALDTTVPGLYSPTFANYAFPNYYHIDGNGVYYYYYTWYNKVWFFVVCGNEKLFLRSNEAYK